MGEFDQIKARIEAGQAQTRDQMIAIHSKLGQLKRIPDDPHVVETRAALVAVSKQLRSIASDWLQVERGVQRAFYGDEDDGPARLLGTMRP
jgi:hypothetical protein